METHRAALLFLLFLPTFFHGGNAMAAGVRQAKWRRELPTYSGSGLYETRYFTQTLDHFNFNPQSYAKFQQRYLVNDTHWGGKGSPIFVYTGNEGGIELFAKNTGFMFEIAPSFKALLVFIEHRYYGESIPFGGEDVAYSNASTLGYLSSTQAIADFATLIIDLKKNLTSEDSPVVAFGGSYGGSKMLAAWFRLKYPHVVLGALASSAPLLQFDDLVSPYTFYNIITNDFRAIDNPTSGNDTFARLYGAMNIYYNYTGKAACFDIDADSLDDTVGMDGWKMILPTEGRSEESMFPANKYNYDDDAGFCESYYGVAPRPHWITTEVLKSLNPSLIAMVIPQGKPPFDLHPFSYEPNMRLCFCSLAGAHHVDLRYSTKEDPVWLQNVRRKEINIIAGWIDQYYADSKL
ncbi:hypothetical protein B296_00013103 [Ensete ventricosum]|uniref:Lysosomal Pro-X carboxypeptidase n=1 Tax=Ensete ventricosum TaxID=4639 RepID=A0A427B1H2_ENSVE|nr:hypothetical protein B296_00013103 [Ensete ventricosum]